MFKAAIVSDDDRESALIVCALRAAGCGQIRLIKPEDAARVLPAGVPGTDLVIVRVANARLLNRLFAIDAPMVVVCAEHLVDSAFLSGAAECVSTPVRARELEGRIRHVMRGLEHRGIMRRRELQTAPTIRFSIAP